MMKKIFLSNKFSIIFHLAAQAGVRFSIKNPDQYYQSNIKGFYNILDLSKTSNWDYPDKDFHSQKYSKVTLNKSMINYSKFPMIFQPVILSSLNHFL